MNKVLISPAKGRYVSLSKKLHIVAFKKLHKQIIKWKENKHLTRFWNSTAEQLNSAQLCLKSNTNQIIIYAYLKTR